MREDELTAAIAKLVSRDHSRVCLSIGDDAAAWQPSRSNRSVITTDALIENVHFSLAYMSFTEVGWRAMAANLSDIAAMGARPVLATVALGIPADATQEQVLRLYDGLDACAKYAGAEIVGGDLTRAPSWTLAITVIGEVRATNLKTRSGARDGDVLAVTGPVGASFAGLNILRGELTLASDVQKTAIAAHTHPIPRVREGAWLGAQASVRAMMDCSDGLSTDLARLARASGVRARLEVIPVAPGATPEYALSGGEDFELLVSVAGRAFKHVAARYRARFERDLLRIGTVEAGEGVVVVKQGSEEPLTTTGWEHFS